MDLVGGRPQRRMFSQVTLDWRIALSVLVVVVLAPLVAQSQYVLQIATLILIWAVLGTGWNLLAGYAGQVSFGHGAYFGIGAYISALMLAKFGITPWVALVVAPLIAGAIGVMIGVPTLRLHGPFFALASMAFQVIMLPIVIYFQDITGGATGLTLPFADSFWELEFSDRTPYYVIYLVITSALMFLMLRLNRSRFGRFLIAIRDNELAAESVGIDTYRYKLLAMAASCAITAFGGVLYVQFIYFVDPGSVFGFSALLQMILVSVFGGIGTPLGPLVGAAILVPLSEVLIRVLGYQLAPLSQVIFGALLMAMVAAMPRGVLGSVPLRLSGSPNAK